MDFYEQEMQKMFGENQCLQKTEFVGKTMLAMLDDRKLLKVEFVNTAAANHYNAVRVSIIDKENGVMDKQIMKFSEIIGTYKLRSSSESIQPFMWDDGERSEWYVPITNAQKAKIAEKVISYAEMFQDQSYDLSMQFR